LTGILLAAIVVFGLPAWVPFIRGKYSAMVLKCAFFLVFLNQVLQFFFISAVGANLIPLYYSTRFATVGVPLCIVAGVLGIRGWTRQLHGTGCIFAGTLGVFVWLFLVSIH
jgi:hypothetical protein